MNEAFENIIDSINRPYISDVSVTDKMSEYAQFASTDVNSKHWDIKITNAKGIDVTETESPLALENITLDSSADGVSWNFKKDYQLKPDYKYRLRFRIKPTKEAFQRICQSNIYPNGPDGSVPSYDNGNGYSVDSGFFSNDDYQSDKDGAYVNYTPSNTEEPEQKNFVEKPVFKLQTKSLTVSKKLKDGYYVDPNKEYSFQLTLKYADNLYKGEPLKGNFGKIITPEGEKDLVFDNDGMVKFKLKAGESVTLNRLPENAVYSVEEIDQSSIKNLEQVSYNITEGIAAETEKTEEDMHKQILEDDTKVVCINKMAEITKTSVEKSGINPVMVLIMITVGGALVILLKKLKKYI